MKVYLDKNGKCINIGDWNYLHDKDGLPTNPMPEDAVEHEAEVVKGYDDGLYLADDPQRLG